MKKRLNVDSVRNELKGGSAFFPGYKSDGEERVAPQPPSHSPTPTEKQTSTKYETPLPQTYQDIPERPNVATPVRPNRRRIITRNSFETYEDQMELLRKLSYKEKMEGK